MAKIAVSYRRADSAAIAGRIFDRLVQQYGDDSVFMDIDDIPFGIDFRHHIKGVLEASDILIAIVGPQWTGGGPEGRSRIKEEADPVRVEIQAALQRNMPLIPVLVDGARMPAADELPEPIQSFAYINAAPVDVGRDFRQHMDRLIRAVDAILAGKTGAMVTGNIGQAKAGTTAPKSGRRWIALGAGAALVVALGVGLWAFGPQLPFTDKQTSAQKTTSAKTPATKTPATKTPATKNASSGSAIPAYTGPVLDEVGLFHPDTRATIARKLSDLDQKAQVKAAIAILKALPDSPPMEYGRKLLAEWPLGGQKGNGFLLLFYPNDSWFTVHAGEGLRAKFGGGSYDVFVNRIRSRFESKDSVGGLLQAVDDLTEIVTGDAAAWQARVTASSSAPGPVQPSQPAPVTYRVLPNVSGGVQNLRGGPATKYPIVTAIPAGATGLSIGTCRKSEDGTRPWCPATWRTYTGWISSCCIVNERTGAPPPLD